MKRTALIILSLLMFGCKKENASTKEQKPEFPKPSSEGRNVMAFISTDEINTIRVVSAANLDGLKAGKPVTYEKNRSDYWHVEMAFTGHEPDCIGYLTLEFDASISDTIFLKYDDKAERPNEGYFRYPWHYKHQLTYRTMGLYPGWVKVTRYDKSSRILAGTFEFVPSSYPFGEDKVEITKGFFDVRF